MTIERGFFPCVCTIVSQFLPMKRATYDFHFSLELIVIEMTLLCYCENVTQDLNTAHGTWYKCKDSDLTGPDM